TVDLGDSAVALLHAMVEDSWRRDLVRPRHHHLVGDGPEHAAVRSLRRAQDRPPYRRTPIIAITPDDPYEIGDLALQMLRERYRGWRGLRDPDTEIIHRLLGGDNPSQGEVLSIVLFDVAFHTELIRLGRRDARRWLRAHDGARFDDAPW
ncbi:MAG: hypothetical protein KY460_02430, partial [Actinobacteria bacterium]|nr:hypothetical protein [Actinomycetota bacterium]